MALDELAEDAVRNNRTKWIAVYIGVLAVLLAICAMGGDNVDKDAQHFNVDATNTRVFIQAKNLRRGSIRLAADELELTLAANPAMSPAARAAIEAKIAEYRVLDKTLTSDPERQEGLDEL